MLTLRMGANAPLTTGRFEVIVEWPVAAGSLDASAFLLGSTGTVRGDDDMIFYNQRAHPSGMVEITGIEDGGSHFAIDLDAAPADVDRVVICVTIDQPGRTMQAFDGTAAMIRSNGETTMRFAPELGSAREVALRLLEIYRRNDVWKVRANGQGFNDGLAPLARSFGIDVAEDEAASARAAPEPVAAPSVPPVSRATEPTAAPKREDGIVRLDGGGTSSHIWPVESGLHLGAISARLSWNSQCGGLDGRPRALELELGCLYELQDGRSGAVQSWDGSGRFDASPFVQLSPAKTDGGTGEQLLRVNGEQWQRIKRIVLYGFIPHGAPSWRAATVSLKTSATDRKPVMLTLDGGVEGCGMAALILIGNRGGDVAFTRLARFLTGHQELNAELGFDLSWRVHELASR